jgi:PKD repeat protein
MNNTSTQQHPVHAFSLSGTYSVRLIVSNVNGCSDTVDKTVTISLSPLAGFTSDSVCQGQATHFSDQSTANATSIISYSWNFGDGSGVSHEQNPVHTYSSYGIKTVTLSVTNSNGCVDDTIMEVLVRPLPEAAFTFSAASCQGFPVQFTDGSTTVAGYLGMITQWVWDFGDGTPAVVVNYPSNPNVAHTFAGTALTFLVTLTVTTSDGCSDAAEHVVSSNASPVAGFTHTPGTCSGQMVQFTDNSQPNGGGNITGWQWNFGDPVSGTGNTSTQQNPTHVFTSSGSYLVSEIVINASGCRDTAVQTVVVSSGPIAAFTSDTACAGMATTFTNLSFSSGGPITQYYWQFGDGGTSTAMNPVHTYSLAGSFPVSLTVTTQDGCTGDTMMMVSVSTPALASFSVNSPVCLGTVVSFTDNSSVVGGMIVSWQWNFGDGVMQTINYPASPNTTHLYAGAGTYTSVLKVTTDRGCLSTTTRSVVVNPSPVANFTYTAAHCANSPVQFTDQSQTSGGPAITGWLWNFGDPGSGSSNTSTLQNPVHSFSTSGSYTVTLVVSSSGGCSSVVSKTVSVGSSPVAQFTSDTACAGSATHFTDQSVANAASIVSWNWNFGDPSSGTGNTSTLENPSHVFTSSGLYMVTLTVINSNLCQKDTVIPVPVYQAPEAMFMIS